MAKKKGLQPNIVEESFAAGYESETTTIPVTQSLLSNTSSSLHNTPTQDLTHNTDHTISNTQYTFPETKKEEIRNKRIQIVVKPSLNKQLDQLVKQKKIKSKNDLINWLLHNYIDNL